jgi:hypothetical protein
MKTALIFDCYDDYEIRIKFIKEAMERAGYTVRVFFSDFDHYAKKYVTKKRDGIEYLHANEYQKNLSCARIHSHQLFAKTCVRKAEEFKEVSLIYVMVPPNSMCKEFAGYHKKHPEVKLMYDLCDMWPESLPVSNRLKSLGAPVFNLWRSYRDKYIGKADCVLSECNLFADQIRSYVPETKLHTVYLCQEHHGSTSNIDESRISFLYCGSINNIINIDLITSFLNEVNQKKKAVLHVIGSGEQKDTLLQSVKDTDVEVIDHGPVYEEEGKQKIYSQCQYGLNLMVDTVFVGLTMKSLDYMSHDLPLINNIKGDTWNLVDQNNIGINLRNGKEEEAAQKIVSMNQKDYEKYRQNVIDVFNNSFDKSIIIKQLDRILEDL